ncbi:monovalent cation/H+ antiporter subunit A [Geminicoccus harenae]|uniref:monovalent cation/H+ antiporter subunit A n=1 Tax=Geminicoccus harenae TaxID=2498453 RepID=UPI00168B7A95|nr:monovalent cation/H+ antiporter subunit A [Geminicoccus harenae]
MTDDTLLISMVVLPFVGAIIAAFLPTMARNAESWLAGTVALAALGCAFLAYPAIAAGGALRAEIPWLASFGLTLAFRMDGFAWLFAMLVSGIGFLVVLYARYYMSPEDPVPRFFSFFLAFMGSMLGIVLSGNLIQLVIFWEMTSIFSFLLIGYWYHNASAREGARISLTVTATGGMALLGGVLLLGHIVGSYDLDEVLSSGNLIRNHPLYLPALILILLGAFTKSAQFPFHFWLPNAMAAPTPVSAYLHSATLVKAGVFLMARLWPVMAGTPEWFWLVGVAGLSSLLIAAYFAIFQQDLKGLLAYSTISHLGLITTLLSLSSPLGAVAAIFHMVNHATFKASLFMAAGIIDHETGTRDMRRLSGLFRFMPITATLAMVASAAMAGVPLLNGFLSKEMFFAEAIETHVPSILDTVTPYVAVIASLFSVTYSVRFIQAVFFGPPPVDLPRTPHEPPFWMRLPVSLLVLSCLVVGAIPGRTIEPFLRLGVTSVLGEATPEFSLAVWHGLNVPLVMSVIALVGGALLSFALKRYLATSRDGPPFFRRVKGQRIFDRLMALVANDGPRFLERYLSTRRLQPQLRLLVAAAILAAFLPLWRQGPGLGGLTFPPVFDPIFTLVWVVGTVCAVIAAYQAKFHRLAALALLGGAGLSVCISFVWLSAPDLALTQLLVEIVTTVLILLGLRWLPKRVEGAMPVPLSLTTRLQRLRDLILAVLAGLGMMLLSYAVMMRPAGQTIGAYFLERAYTEGGGTNVVNVILVDFRGFDTLGEITVLAIVALTVFALLRRFRPAPDSIPPPMQQQIQRKFDVAAPDRDDGATLTDYLYVASVIMQWLFPIVIVLALYLFLRGHDLPGGGFAAGIAMTSAFIMQYMAVGTRWLEDRLRVLPLVWMGFGLLLATATGLGSWLFGYPFLTSHSRYLEIPLIGEVPAATALLFDLGVFSLVLGATVLMLIAIAHQSIRRIGPARAANEAEET